MKRTHDRDEGAVAVIVAIFLVALFTFGSLAVDVGYWYNVERRLQVAADAAALAGCQSLIRGGTQAEVWDEVEDYAARNSAGIVETSTIDYSRSYVDMDRGMVKVTLLTDSRSFLARVIGTDQATIPVQAVAKAGYLGGARNPIPWGLPIIQPTRVTAQAGGGPEIDLSENSDGTWSGSLPSGSSGQVSITTWNDQTLDPSYPDGVPEVIEPVASIGYLPSNSPFVDISIDKQLYTSGLGESVEVRVETTGTIPAGAKIEAAIGKTKTTLTAVSPTVFTGSIAAPTTDDLWTTFTMSVTLVDGKNSVTVSPAATFAVRRPTYPVKNVIVEPTIFQSGSPGPVQVTVELNDYEYGKKYELKVIGGQGEVGNFMALDFGMTYHDPYWDKTSDPEEYPDMPSYTGIYYEFIEGIFDYPFVLHINDTVWTNTGNLSGPTTEKALDARFATAPVADFAGWIAAGKPETPRVIYVPIVEKLQETTGQSAVRIVSFAVFYVEDYSKEGLITGRFVEYASPSWVVVDDPPANLNIRVAHLVSDDLDF